MDLRHLRYFLAVAEELNFTRAAARLGIAQPPLSQQIQQLEREVGAPLFHRPPRGVALTEAGRRLVGDAQEILLLAERALANAKRAAQGELGTIRIGFTSSASFHPFVTATIRDYRSTYPDVGVNLIEDTTARLLTLLGGRGLDAAFIRPLPGEVAHLQNRFLFQEEMLVALPIDHPLAQKPTVMLKALAQEAFILYPRRNGRALYDAIVGACETAGFAPRIRQEAPQMASIINLVASGIGISIVPASMSQIQAPGVTFRPIRGPKPHAGMSFVSRDADAQSPLHAFSALIVRRLAAAGAQRPTRARS